MPIVRVHHPDISEDERKARVEEIKKALIEFYKEGVFKNECNTLDSNNN